MQCQECGGTMKKVHGIYRINDKFAGVFTVPDIEYMECDRCDEVSFSLEEAKKISDCRKNTIQKKLRALPYGDFISAPEAAKILGITRQAFHKNKKIQRGFIYQTAFNTNDKAYLKRSVELFKEKGDGRFKLDEYMNCRVVVVEYKASTEVIPKSINRYSPRNIDPTRLIYKTILPKGKSYEQH